MTHGSTGAIAPTPGATAAPASASGTATGPGRASVVLQFLGMGLFWGSSFLFMKVALDGVSFSQVSWSRLVLGGVTLGLIVLVMRPRVGTGPVLPREPIVWLHFTVIAITFCVIPHTLYAWAEQYVTSSLASIYNAATPIATALMATLAFRVEKLSALRWAGVAVGIGGVIVIIAPWQVRLGGELAGQLACLGAVVCYGFILGYTKRFLSSRPIAPATFAFLNIGIAGVIMALLTPVVAWQPVQLDLPVVASLVALGVLGTGLAYVWQVNVLRAWGPTGMSTVTYVTPVVGVVLGVLLLHERFGWHEPVGAVLVLAGILLAQGRVDALLAKRAVARGAAPA
ncbi:DMT family transporter [Agromyces sp. SYSU T00194]|uniref:DMT family transporter n=1 Tax=Agromyces chitinivorans TaxID=3158560 RepID=UPI0033924B0F